MNDRSASENPKALRVWTKQLHHEDRTSKVDKNITPYFPLRFKQGLHYTKDEKAHLYTSIGAMLLRVSSLEQEQSILSMKVQTWECHGGRKAKSN